MQKLFVVIFFFSFINVQAQDTVAHKLNAGAELDVLPYITGGHFAAVWIGKNEWRVRALTAFVKKPDFTTKDGFANHHIHAYAIVIDKFFKPGWKGLWLGGGLVYWRSSIQTDAKQQTAYFNNYLLNGSAGYHFTLYKHLYLSPWAGMSLRIGGDKNVAVDNKQFTLPLLNPEASLKLGYSF